MRKMDSSGKNGIWSSLNCKPARDIQHAQQVAKTSTFEIDAIHKKFKENWDRVYPAKLLVDLENDTTDKMS
ncbi:hypothetical protein RFY41_13950 [Acinetobacter soli]|uniref:hypothetical protein n=2 Tax=Acinetobacter soli TaxID=487316 RepID=UPI0027DE4B00|nr:hypothetical protein [Acinetobacter soli]MDQ9834111.1 hypothetical protein [Acinetobacter soli]